MQTWSASVFRAYFLSLTAPVEMATEHINRAGLMEKFKDLEIEPVITEHPEVFTVEEMMPHVAHLSGAHTKNLFLKDKKKKLWLLSARHDANVNLSSLAKKVGAPGGLRFADETILQEKLGVRQGCVTPLALINDRANDVTFILDESLVDGTFERMHFHPMDNAATIGLTPTEFLKFLNAINHNPVSVKLE